MYGQTLGICVLSGPWISTFVVLSGHFLIATLNTIIANHFVRFHGGFGGCVLSGRLVKT